MTSTDRQRWARVRPSFAWKQPGLPRAWTRVLERNREAMDPHPLPSHVWLDTPGKVLHADERHLEFTVTRQSGPSAKKIDDGVMPSNSELALRMVRRSWGVPGEHYLSARTLGAGIMRKVAALPFRRPGEPGVRIR